MQIWRLYDLHHVNHAQRRRSSSPGRDEPGSWEDQDGCHQRSLEGVRAAQEASRPPQIRGQAALGREPRRPPQTDDLPSSMRVLVDTSVWVDFLNGHPSPEREALANL